jgi:phage-related protein
MPKLNKRLPAFFYSTPSGKEPVREWLLSLDDESRMSIGKDIATVEWGWPVGMPVARKLENGLYEVRSNISSRRIARVIFAPHAGKMVLLHGFVKKTQTTPKFDLSLAKKRAKETAS